MATITEDYCSKDIYRLLLEKGFDGEIHTTFDKEGYTQASITLQMAMKWLREVHHLYIDVGFGNDYKGEFLYMGDIYDLTKDAIHAKYEPIIEADDYLSNNPKTYEEACESAIKYCLENLI